MAETEYFPLYKCLPNVVFIEGWKRKFHVPRFLNFQRCPKSLEGNNMIGDGFAVHFQVATRGITGMPFFFFLMHCHLIFLCKVSFR